MADPLTELTVNWTEDGVLKVRELDRAVLATSTSWATLAFLFQEHDAASGSYRAPKVSIRRYRRRAGRNVVDKHLTLSTEKQATELMDCIGKWFASGGRARTAEVAEGSVPRAGVGAAPVTDDE